jgi:hypothetical protein
MGKNHEAPKSALPTAKDWIKDGKIVKLDKKTLFNPHGYAGKVAWAEYQMAVAANRHQVIIEDRDPAKKLERRIAAMQAELASLKTKK